MVMVSSNPGHEYLHVWVLDASPFNGDDCLTIVAHVTHLPGQKGNIIIYG